MDFFNEEENKAIKKLKSYKELFSKGYCKDCNELCAIDNFPSKDLENNIDTLLNLIEKQQKEIEEKTTIIMAGAEKVKQLEKEFITKQKVKENYIPKSKIEEKIKDLKIIDEYDGPNGWESERSYAEELLQELLEEE